MTYEAPKVTELGSLRELTLAFNKLGPTPDTGQNAAQGIVGSLKRI